MPPNFIQLVFEARRQLALSNKDFAQLSGVSLRSVERHSDHGGISNPRQTEKLILAIHPRNPGLAAQLAAAGHVSLASLGLATAPAAAVAPAPPAPAPGFAAAPTIPPARPEHANSVLLAAANALYLPPEAVRPAVAAAFAKAKELGVSVAGLADHLAQPPSASVAGTPKAGKSA